MARRNNRQSRGRERDLSNVATAISAVLRPDLVETFRPVSLSPILREVEDLRSFHPEGAERRPLSVFGQGATWNVVPSVARSLTTDSTGRLPGTLRFNMPREVAVCVRRKVRRQVLWALGKAGGGSAKPRRTWRSNIKCK